MSKNLRDSFEQLLEENRISLTQLAQEQHVSVPTAWRWSTAGSNGHVLPTFRLGKKRFTTREAFARWVARINGTKLSAGRQSKKRNAEIRAAEARVASAGVR